jgi:RNA polymerase sigma-70 factor (ECF subfamily)
MPNAPSDEELMFEVRNGVGEMLGVLFNRYEGPLFSFYSRLTGDRTASEDLVQDVFYRILKYRHTYRPGTPFRTWMYHIARNARLDRMRKQLPVAEVDSAFPVAAETVDSVEKEQEAALLRRAMTELPADKREVLLLSRFQDLSYQEIAQLLGCEVAAIKVRVFRALKDLRDILRRLEQQTLSVNQRSQQTRGVES